MSGIVDLTSVCSPDVTGPDTPLPSGTETTTRKGANRGNVEEKETPKQLCVLSTSTNGYLSLSCIDPK